MNKRKGLILLINLGIVAVVMILAWIFGPSLWVELHYQQQVKNESQVEMAEGTMPTKGFGSLMYSMTGFGELLDEVVLEEPESYQFGLVIPKIFANVAVTENVNPADPEKYQEALRELGGVAHAIGSSVPGELGTTYIFGHSTDASINVARFNAVFYLLRKLAIGDIITAYYHGEQFDYRVAEKKVVDPDDITDIVGIEDKERLVLQTCWPPGTTWKRLLVVAEPVSESASK